MNKQKAIKITAYALAGVVLGGALVFYNFIEKESVGAKQFDFCPSITVNTVYKTVEENGEKKFAIDEQQSFDISNYAGKVVVLNFWATWCDPCRHEIPYFNELYENYAEDVEVVLVSEGGESPQELIDDALNNKNATFYEADYKKWVDYSCTFICPDAGQSVLKQFDVAGTLPVTVIVDRKGTIQQIFQTGLTYEQLETEVLKYI